MMLKHLSPVGLLSVLVITKVMSTRCGHDKICKVHNVEAVETLISKQYAVGYALCKTLQELSQRKKQKWWKTKFLPCFYTVGAESELLMTRN